MQYDRSADKPLAVSARSRWLKAALWLFGVVFTLVGPTALQAETAASRRGMVATVHPLATDAGLAVLENGGSAVDAAVAAALTLGVVDGHNSGIGGGCFILIRRPDGSFVAIDGRETAPAKAHRDMFVDEGTVRSEWSKTGPLASGVPGALAAYDLAVRRHGRKPLKDLLEPAAEIAENGFRVDRVYARNLKSVAETLAGFAGSRNALLKPDGTPYLEGELLRQPDLAETYRSVACEGIEWFYRGPFAEAVEQWMARHGGLHTRADFAQYRAIERKPVVTAYREYTIVGFPPPSSGGVHVAQILNILERFDLRQLHQNDAAQFFHVIAESMKLAFADRAYWLGDADFAAVPRGLVDDAYAASLADRIDLQCACSVAGHGHPPGDDTDVFGKHTTHIAAADGEGCWVAITATVNTTFGSKVVIPGTGVVLNNQMDDFSIQPGVPNAFGLIGAEANAIAPGKRPLSSMSPTVVLRQGQPIMTVGAAGGPTIISQVVQAVIRHIDLEQSLDAAVAAPRIHHQWSPDKLYVEDAVPAELVERLREYGHVIGNRKGIGVTQAISSRSSTGELVGVHDPRVPGKAAGR